MRPLKLTSRKFFGGGGSTFTEDQYASQLAGLEDAGFSSDAMEATQMRTASMQTEKRVLFVMLNYCIRQPARRMSTTSQRRFSVAGV